MKSTSSNLFSSASSTTSLEESSPNDDILNALKSNTSSPLATTSTSLTGKYLSQEGEMVDSTDISSVKHVHVTCLHKLSSFPYCFGTIGVNKNSFCLKPKATCRVTSHSTSVFEPDLDHYYINKNQHGDSAWCDFKLHKNVVETLKLQGINFDESKPVEDWKLLFTTSSKLSTETTTEIERAIEYMKDPPKVALTMKTPAKQKLQKTLSSNEKVMMEIAKIEANAALLHITQAEKDDWTTIIPTDLIMYIENLSDMTKSLVAELNEVHAKLEKFACLDDVSSDFTDISSGLSGLKSSLGSNSKGLYPDLWTAVNDLQASAAAVNSNPITIQRLTTSYDVLESRINACNTTIKSFGQRWEALGQNWLPLLHKHEQALEEMRLKSSPLDVDSFLNAGISQVSSTVNADTNTNQALLDKIHALENRLSLLEDKSDNKTVSFQPSAPIASPRRDAFGFGTAGVSFKQYYFADEDEVKVWMKSNLSTPSHGLFVDLVSFTQFFGDDAYVERNVSLNDLYMSNKIGYQTMADAYVATSFENVLPAAYGRNANASSTKASSNADMQSQPELPGLPSFEKWDHTDGGTGRKYWIAKECRKTGIQIDGMIRAQLEGPAQLLAKDLLTDSISMSEALFNFISTSYQDTFNSGRFDTAQAWQLTCKFVKRIFVELGDVRITARAGIHINDPWTSAAKFLFATLRAHEVMHSFMRLDIKNHPSISSEMVKFICYSQPASDTSEVLNRLSATESMQRTHQSNISKLDLKAKKVDAWKADTDKLLKKLKEKNDIA